jgi:cellulose synthase/poly-beta-1,6-N-acetylglucosamine synthase-like glycosyltransferase
MFLVSAIRYLLSFHILRSTGQNFILIDIEIVLLQWEAYSNVKNFSEKDVEGNVVHCGQDELNISC